MKGQVLTFEKNEGIILGEDEKRYEFDLNEWKEKVPPKKGMKVDFIYWETELLNFKYLFYKTKYKNPRRSWSYIYFA